MAAAVHGMEEVVGSNPTRSTNYFGISSRKEVTQPRARLGRISGSQRMKPFSFSSPRVAYAILLKDNAGLLSNIGYSNFTY